VNKWEWSEDGKEEFRRALGKVVESGEGVGEVWEEIKKRNQEILGGGCKEKVEKRKRSG
jgi:hypothetical protein